MMKLDLLNKDGGTPRSTRFIRITELNEDLDLTPIDSLSSYSSIELPLNPARLDTSFEFVTSDSVTFHLGVTYKTYTRVVGVDCGAFLYYENLVVDSAKTDFDAVKLINSKLFTGVKTNLELYF